MQGNKEGPVGSKGRRLQETPGIREKKAKKGPDRKRLPNQAPLARNTSNNCKQDH